MFLLSVTGYLYDVMFPKKSQEEPDIPPATAGTETPSYHTVWQDDTPRHTCGHADPHPTHSDQVELKRKTTPLSPEETVLKVAWMDDRCHLNRPILTVIIAVVVSPSPVKSQDIVKCKSQMSDNGDGRCSGPRQLLF